MLFCFSLRRVMFSFRVPVSVTHIFDYYNLTLNEVIFYLSVDALCQKKFQTITAYFHHTLRFSMSAQNTKHAHTHTLTHTHTARIARVANTHTHTQAFTKHFYFRISARSVICVCHIYIYCHHHTQEGQQNIISCGWKGGGLDVKYIYMIPIVTMIRKNSWTLQLLANTPKMTNKAWSVCNYIYIYYYIY